MDIRHEISYPMREYEIKMQCCQYILKRGKNKGIRCGKKTFADSRVRLTHLDIIEIKDQKCKKNRKLGKRLNVL